VWLVLGVGVLLQMPAVSSWMGLRLPRTSAQLANVLCMSLHIVITRPSLALRNAAALCFTVLAPALAVAIDMDAALSGPVTARMRQTFESERDA
jgi:hypothetical protein